MSNLIATICAGMLRGKRKGKLYGEVVLRAPGFTFTCVDYADGYLYKKGMLLVEVLLEWQDQCASTSVPWKTVCLSRWRHGTMMCRT